MVIFGQHKKECEIKIAVLSVIINRTYTQINEEGDEENNIWSI